MRIETFCSNHVLVVRELGLGVRLYCVQYLLGLNLHRHCIISGSNHRYLVSICSLVVTDYVYIGRTVSLSHHENCHNYPPSRKQVQDFLIIAQSFQFTPSLSVNIGKYNKTSYKLCCVILSVQISRADPIK